MQEVAAITTGALVIIAVLSIVSMNGSVVEWIVNQKSTISTQAKTKK